MKYILYLCSRVMPPFIHNRAASCKKIIFMLPIPYALEIFTGWYMQNGTFHCYDMALAHYFF